MKSARRRRRHPAEKAIAELKRLIRRIARRKPRSFASSRRSPTRTHRGSKRH